jgi:hypothetical protein
MKLPGGKGMNSKKIGVLIAFALIATICTAQEVKKEAAYSHGLLDFSGWMLANPALRNSAANGSWSPDQKSAPTDTELATMLKTALLPGSAHMLTPVHFVVIRDYAEQMKMLSGMKGMVSPGTVAVLVLADVLRDKAHHQEAYNDWYQQMYYGILDAGYALGYLNLAAIGMGYRTHCYAFLNIPVNGKVEFSNGGQFNLIQGDNWDVSKYLSSKDGSVKFVHTVGAYTMGKQGPESKDIAANGNLSLLAVMVIGKIDQGKVDAISSATNAMRPYNLNFWDPQDGKSYGNLGGMPSIDRPDATSGATKKK